MSNRAGQGRFQVAEISAGQATGCQNCLTCRPLMRNNKIQEKV